MRSHGPYIQRGLIFTLVLALLSQASLASAWRPAAGASAPVARRVLIVQDIHANADVQHEIGRQIQSLIDGKMVDLVALEGSEGPIALDVFQRYPNKRRLSKVAEYLLANNKITGPIAAALESVTRWPRVVGVDSGLHHALNVLAYQRSVSLQPSLGAEFERRRTWLARGADATLSDALRRFDALAEKRTINDLSLLVYLKQAERLSPVLLSAPLKRYVWAATLESGFDAAAIRTQRQSYLRAVLARLPGRERAAFLAEISKERQPSATPAWVDTRLLELGEKQNVSLSAYPAFCRYAFSLALMRDLQGERILEATQQWEADSYAALIKTPREREFVRQRRELRLLRRLVAFELTPSEWDAYQTMAHAHWVRALDLSAFEKFYAEADARSRLMAENLSGDMARTGAARAVLVCGGFHQSAVARLLRANGISVEVTQPHLQTPVVASDHALQLFLKAPDPIEHFLSGPRVMLSLPPFDPQIQDLAKAMLAASGADLSDLQADFEIRPMEPRSRHPLDFYLVRNGSALPVRATLDAEGNVVALQPLGPSRRMHSTLKIDPAHPTSTEPQIRFEGDAASVKKWFESLHTKADGRRARNFSTALNNVMEKWKILKDENISFRIITGGAALASIHDDVIDLEDILCDDPDLLTMELREEAHHLLFLRMMETTGQDPMNFQTQFFEELTTDLNKIALFKTLGRTQQHNVLAALFQKFHNPFFAEVLIMSLHGQDRRATLAMLHNKEIISPTQWDKLLRQSKDLSSAKHPRPAIALLMNYYQSIGFKLPEIDIADWQAAVTSHQERLEQFLKTPQPVVPLAGGGSLSPFRRKVVRVADDEYWIKKYKGKTVVVVEPHPDDAVISMGVTLRKIKAAGAIIHIITLLPDFIGVSDEFAKMDLGIPVDTPTNEEGLRDHKRTIRQRESHAFIQHTLGINNAYHWEEHTELPHGLPQGPYQREQLEALHQKAWNDLSVGGNIARLQTRLFDFRSLLEMLPASARSTLLPQFEKAMEEFENKYADGHIDVPSSPLSSPLYRALYRMLVARDTEDLLARLRAVEAETQVFHDNVFKSLEVLGVGAGELGNELQTLDGALKRMQRLMDEVAEYGSPKRLDKQKADIEDVVRIMETQNHPDFWFLPNLNINTPHHSHHETVNVVFVQQLRKLKFTGRLNFYETYEHTGGFDTEDHPANLIVEFGPDAMAVKKNDVRHYYSQIGRREYDERIAARNAAHAVAENVALGRDDVFVERFIEGKLNLDSTGQSHHARERAVLFMPAFLKTDLSPTARLLIGALALGWYFHPQLMRVWQRIVSRLQPAVPMERIDDERLQPEPDFKIPRAPSFARSDEYAQQA
jgi:hypothetical protein